MSGSLRLEHPVIQQRLRDHPRHLRFFAQSCRASEMRRSCPCTRRPIGSTLPCRRCLSQRSDRIGGQKCLTSPFSRRVGSKLPDRPRHRLLVGIDAAWQSGSRKFLSALRIPRRDYLAICRSAQLVDARILPRHRTRMQPAMGSRPAICDVKAPLLQRLPARQRHASPSSVFAGCESLPTTIPSSRMCAPKHRHPDFASE